MMDTDESKFILRNDKVIEDFKTDNLYKYVIADWVHHDNDLAVVSVFEPCQSVYFTLW
jgi:hypothetical protein